MNKLLLRLFKNLTKINWNVILHATCGLLLHGSKSIPEHIVNIKNMSKMEFFTMDFLKRKCAYHCLVKTYSFSKSKVKMMLSIVYNKVT